MKEFAKKIIIPTVIMIWAATFYVEVNALPARNGLLIKPVFWAMLVLYIINGVSDFIECRRKVKEDAAAGNATEKTSDGGVSVQKVKQALKAFCVSSTGRIVLSFAAMILYVAVIKKVGFCISTFALLVALLLLMDVRSWKSLILFPLIFVAMIYVVFKLFLGIYLPAGFFM